MLYEQESNRNASFLSWALGPARKGPHLLIFLGLLAEDGLLEPMEIVSTLVWEFHRILNVVCGPGVQRDEGHHGTMEPFLPFRHDKNWFPVRENDFVQTRVLSLVEEPASLETWHQLKRIMCEMAWERLGFCWPEKGSHTEKIAFITRLASGIPLPWRGELIPREKGQISQDLAPVKRIRCEVPWERPGYCSVEMGKHTGCKKCLHYLACLRDSSPLSRGLNLVWKGEILQDLAAMKSIRSEVQRERAGNYSLEKGSHRED